MRAIIFVAGLFIFGLVSLANAGFTLYERWDLQGMDIGSPIDFTYALPFTYTGTIDKVVIKLGEMDLGKR
jgi:hypothetical protein